MELQGIVRGTLLAVVAAGLVSSCTTKQPRALRGEAQLPTAGLESVPTELTPGEARSRIVVTIAAESLVALTEGRAREPDTSPGYVEFLDALNREFGVTPVQEWPLESIGAWCLVLASENRFPQAELLQRLLDVEFIDTAQPLHLFDVVAQPNNDPHRKLQTNLDAIRAERAHSLATGLGVTVALVDTGIDDEHVDLDGRIAGTKNVVDDDEDVFRSDVHGTAVASVIAANRNNGIGMIGVAPSAQILAIKACWQTRPGFTGARCSTYSLAKAIDHAISASVDVINLSIVGPADEILERLLAAAIKKDIVVVAAAGRSEAESFITAVPGALAATDGEGGDSVVKIQAKDILAARPTDEYDFFSGRSLAAAQLSGIVALLRERRAHLSGREILALLKESERVDACSALAAVTRSPC